MKNETNLFKIEACIGTLQSGIEAEKGGANRVELCDNLAEGGTTPSAALIQMSKEKLQIPAAVMIRPRHGDFLYSDLEFEIMKKENELKLKVKIFLRILRKYIDMNDFLWYNLDNRRS